MHYSFGEPKKNYAPVHNSQHNYEPVHNSFSVCVKENYAPMHSSFRIEAKEEKHDNHERGDDDVHMP